MFNLISDLICEKVEGCRVGAEGRQDINMWGRRGESIELETEKKGGRERERERE